MTKRNVLLIFFLLFAAEVCVAAETKWSLIPNKEAEDEQKKMPATLNSIISKHRAKQSEKTVETGKMEPVTTTISDKQAPTTFTADLPSGMTYSSYSSSSSSRLVGGKWVTETVSTEVKPDAQNKLRGTTKKETTIVPLTSDTASTAIRTSSSSSSSTSSSSSSSSMSSSSSSSLFAEPDEEEDLFASSPINDVFRSVSAIQNSFLNRGPAAGLMFPSSMRVNTFRQFAENEDERKK